MKDKFKEFIKNKQYLIKYVESGKMTWQKFYELYSLYGEDEKVWNEYKSDKDERKIDVSKIGELVKNVDIDSIKEHISTAQKALDFVQELTAKPKISSDVIKPFKEINNFFED